MSTFELPAYVDPAVLRPGQRVQCVVDGEATVLTVVRVEPALVCSRPDGTGVMILAHSAVPLDEPAPRYVCGARWTGPGYDRHCDFTTSDEAAARAHWQQTTHWVDGLDS